MWNPTLLEDGDDADAASLNTPFGLAQTAINDLEREAIPAGAFGKEHVHSLFHRSNPQTVSSEGEFQEYDFATFGVSMTYATFGADGGSDSGVMSGDRAVLGHPSCAGYTGSPCAIALTGGGWKIGMDAGDRVSAILALLNAELIRVDANGGVVTGLKVMVCLQFRLDSGGTWYTIDSSERFVSLDDHKIDLTSDTENISFDIPIAALIVPSMVDAIAGKDHLVNEVSDVRAMVSLSGAVAGTSFTFHRWNMTVAPLYTSEVA